MVFFNKIRDFFVSLEERTFYYYLGGFLGFMLIFSAGMIYYIYDSTSGLVSDIETINEEREGEVRKLLQKGAQIKNKQKEMDKMLAEDKNYKISQEFNNLCRQANMTAARVGSPVQSDIDEKYQESTLTADFLGISMRQLLEFLQAIERVARIYTKQLDITKSKKGENSLDVKLVIATLLPKTVETD